MRLKVESDLSEFALEQAVVMIRKEHEEGFLPRNEFKLYYVLKVPSQGLSDALVLQASSGLFHVELSLDYDPDEWSLNAFGWNNDMKRVDFSVWSPGA